MYYSADKAAKYEKYMKRAPDSGALLRFRVSTLQRWVNRNWLVNDDFQRFVLPARISKYRLSKT